MPTAVPSLTPAVRAFLSAPRIVTIATVGQDGAPHQAAIWYRLEPDGRILVNSHVGRRWPTDLESRPRCSLAVLDEADPYRWVGLDGVVDAVIRDPEQARDDIIALGVRYGDTGEAAIASWRSQERITFLIRVPGVHDHLEG